MPTPKPKATTATKAKRTRASKPAAPAPALPHPIALPWAEVSRLTDGGIIAQTMLQKQAEKQAAFASIGKLYVRLKAVLKDGEDISPFLRDRGISPGTISNASYSSKVWKHVGSALTEPEFDTLGFRDVFNFVRVTSAKSAKQLTPEEAATVLRDGGTWNDLEAIFTDGVTAAEKAAAEAAAEAAKAEAAAAKEAAAAEAAAQAERDRAELERLRSENATLAAQSTAPAPETETPAPAPAASAESESESESDDSDDIPPAPDHDPTEDTEEPAPVVQAPAPAAPNTARTILDLLDEIELSMLDLAPEDQAVVAARIFALANTLAESGITPAPQLAEAA